MIVKNVADLYAAAGVSYAPPEILDEVLLAIHLHQLPVPSLNLTKMCPLTLYNKCTTNFSDLEMLRHLKWDKTLPHLHILLQPRPQRVALLQHRLLMCQRRPSSRCRGPYGVRRSFLDDSFLDL